MAPPYTPPLQNLHFWGCCDANWECDLKKTFNDPPFSPVLKYVSSYIYYSSVFLVYTKPFKNLYTSWIWDSTELLWFSINFFQTKNIFILGGFYLFLVFWKAMSLKVTKIMFMFSVHTHPCAEFIVECILALWFRLHPIWGANLFFNGNCFTFSLGRGVGHVPGEHKPDFRAFQTHSFSEHPKKIKSIKYKYIFGRRKFRSSWCISFV